jgi:tetratricopeptide (TPR) repeat protein
MTINLPLLPLRDIVVFPHMIVPLFVGRDKSVAALEHAMSGEKEIFLVAQLDPEILAIETRRALVAITPSKDAYACVLRALALIYRFEEADWREAMTLLGQARTLDPLYARCQAVSAKCRIIGIAQGWSSNPLADLQRADTEANQAIGLDPRDSLGLALAAHIRTFVHHDFDGALALYDRAVKSNPSCGLSWGYSALTHAYMGRIDEARRRLDRARSIVIHDPFLSHIDGFRAVVAFFARDWDEAVRLCQLELRARPRFDNVRKLLIGALCHAGRFEEAAIEDARLRDGDPNFCWSRHLETYPFYHSVDRDNLVTSLVRAGLMSGALFHDEGMGKSLDSTTPVSLCAAAVVAAAPLKEHLRL